MCHIDLTGGSYTLMPKGGDEGANDDMQYVDVE
jgi:hypothetical protein